MPKPSKMSFRSKKPSSSTASTSLDIRRYINRYNETSETRIQRLLFLARNSNTSTENRKIACTLLEEQLRSASNAKRYEYIFDTPSLKDVAESMPSEYDASFVESATERNNHQYDALMANLRTSRASLGKDTIYQSTIQLVNHLMMTGRTREAMGQLVNTKAYCSGIWQLQEMTLLLAEACLGIGEYGRVRELYDPGVDKRRGVGAKGGRGMAGDDSTFRKTFLSKLNAARGLAYLAEGNINDAAHSFLAVTEELRDDFNTVLSGNDIALYGGLSALIALDRKEMGSTFSLEKSSSSSSSGNDRQGGTRNVFRTRLDGHPAMRDAIQAYIRADYGECLRSVETLRKGWENDIYLAPQAENLWRLVRGKCLVQYFEPYSSVSLHSVMDSFAFKNVDEAEDIVADLLERKEIVGAKIDGVDHILNGTSAEELERRMRRKMIRKLGRMGEGLLDEVNGTLLRTACTEKGLVVGKAGGKGLKSRGRRRGWGDAMKESDSGAAMFDLYSSDEDGGTDMIIEGGDEADLMETDI